MKHEVRESFKLIDGKGIDAILKSIPIYVKADNDTIGIVIDADENIAKRWTSLQSILTKIGYTVPQNMDKNGTIIQKEDLPTLGIWLMPNNDENGMLEDFVKNLISEDDKIMPFVESTLKELESRKLNKYKPIHQSKAKIHTWLAWQKTPGTPMGLAINKTYLDTNQVFCVKLVNWINELYNT